MKNTVGNETICIMIEIENTPSHNKFTVLWLGVFSISNMFNNTDKNPVRSSESCLMLHIPLTNLFKENEHWSSFLIGPFNISRVYSTSADNVPIICFVLHQPATPSRPPVVVEWASGVAPKPDPKTISKHVQRMVDVS